MKTALNSTILILSSIIVSAVVITFLFAASSQFDSGFGGYSSLAKTGAYIFFSYFFSVAIATIVLLGKKSKDWVSKSWFISALISLLVLSFIPLFFGRESVGTLFNLAWEILTYSSQRVIIGL